MKKIKVMIAGLPGNMATLVAEGLILRDDIELCPVGLSHTKQGTILVTDGRKTGPEYYEMSLAPETVHRDIIVGERPDMIVDFARGSSVKNCGLYCDLGVPFVMGSTGGDRAIMVHRVEQSNISAVIAPNMAIPVVVIQAMLEHAAQNFPGALSGFSLRIAESHQKEKNDTSGTALTLEKLLNILGAISDKDGILSIREPLIQKRLCGISPKYLGGHGHHEYVLVSADETVHLALVHNVDGRNVYVDGTIQAARFLAGRLGQSGRAFSMTDVLKNS